MTANIQKLTASDFARGIILGLISRGVWRFYSLERPWGHRAAETVYNLIRDNYSDVFDLDFCIFLHEIHGTSDTWYSAVGSLISSTVLVRSTDGSYIAKIPRDHVSEWVETIPGDLAFWQGMAIAYRDYCPHCID
ncbi:MAG: hypothetical protein WBB94_03610 [Candidatus Saccharimonadaceae bacterium]